MPPAPEPPPFARWLVPGLAALTLLPVVSTGAGLVAGVAVALLVGNPWGATTRKLTPTLLQASVIGLGFGADLRVVVEVGTRGIGYTAVGIAATLAAGLLLTRILRVSRDLGLLVSVGTAICGGSAIAAVVPAIGAREDDATVSLAVVFLLNAVGLLVFPPLGHLVGLDQDAFGLWAALAVHDTSSVVGAASAYGPRALEVATTLKLARALWIVPLALGLGFWASRTAPADAASTKSKPKLPWFILGFLATAALATYVPAIHEWGHGLARVARQLLVTTLFLIGANLSRSAVQAVGARPLVLGVSLWVSSATGSLAAILTGWIR
jgi:uncharacterized integral membrane protein (TIGR00698 family)